MPDELIPELSMGSPVSLKGGLLFTVGRLSAMAMGQLARMRLRPARWRLCRDSVAVLRVR